MKLLIFVMIFAVWQLKAKVVINEFVSSNGTVIADEDGDFSDWIELFNSGDLPVDLAGFGLSDSLQRPFKWIFPEVTLAPGEFLLIWASNKDRRDASAPLHSNFAISAGGEPITLTGPDGIIQDFVPATSLARDEALARIPDGSANWITIRTPTPGAPNTGLVQRVEQPPTISVSSGFHNSPITVNLTHPDPDVTIIYSLDGSTPTVERLQGQFYWYKNVFPEQPGDPFGEHLWGVMQTHQLAQTPLILRAEDTRARLSFRATTNQRSTETYAPLHPPYTALVLRARAIREGAEPSPVASVTLFHDRPIEYFNGELPIISLQLDSYDLFEYFTGIYTAGHFFDAWRTRFPDEETFLWSGFANYFLTGSETEKRAHFELFDANGRLLQQRDIGLRLHGGTSRSHPQKSLRLYFNETYDLRGPFNYEVFPGLHDHQGDPLTRFHRLVLRNSGNDHRDTRIRDGVVGRVLAPLGLGVQAFTPAIHFLNGEFWGLINIRERMDRFFIESNFGVPANEVALIEIGFPEDELSEGTPQDLADFRNLREFIRFNDLSDQDSFAAVSAQMNVESFLLHHMAQIFIKNTDWPGNNIRVWRAPGGLWQYTFHDLDFALGPFWGLDVDHNTLAFALEEGNDAWPNPDDSTVMLRGMLQNDGFRARFIQSFADHMATTFLPSRIEEIVHELHSRIAPYLQAHGQRWTNFRNTDPSFMVDFAHQRPGYVREHILEYFNLTGMSSIQWDVSSREAGSLWVNTLQLEEEQLPFRNVYFSGVPLAFGVSAHAGFEFVGWNVPELVTPVAWLFPEDVHSVTALFRRQIPPNSGAVLSWLYQGIYWSSSWYDHPVLGWLYQSAEDDSIVWSPTLGWVKILTGTDDQGVLLFSVEDSRWFWSPVAELGLIFCFDQSVWISPTRLEN